MRREVIVRFNSGFKLRLNLDEKNIKRLLHECLRGKTELITSVFPRYAKIDPETWRNVEYSEVRETYAINGAYIESLHVAAVLPGSE